MESDRQPSRQRAGRPRKYATTAAAKEALRHQQREYKKRARSRSQSSTRSASETISESSTTLKQPLPASPQQILPSVISQAVVPSQNQPASIRINNMALQAPAYTLKSTLSAFTANNLILDMDGSTAKSGRSGRFLGSNSSTDVENDMDNDQSEQGDEDILWIGGNIELDEDSEENILQRTSSRLPNNNSSFPRFIGQNDQQIQITSSLAIDIDGILDNNIEDQEMYSGLDGADVNEPEEHTKAEALRVTSQFLVRNLFEFQGCSEDDHREKTLRLREKREEDILPDRGICTIEDLVGITEEAVDRDFKEIFTTGKWTGVDQLPDMSPEVWRLLGRGIGISGQNFDCPPELSLPLSQAYQLLQRDCTPHLWDNQFTISTTFDIDSIMAMPTSLQVANHGIEFNMSPQYIHNIQNDLHIKIHINQIPGQKPVTVRLDKVPHFRLGIIPGLVHLELFVFLPGLYDETRPSNFPTQQQLTRFFDHLLLPALASQTDSHYAQHIPSSYAHAKMNGQAPSAEGLKSRKMSKETNFIHHLPSEYLGNVWDYIMDHVGDPGFHDFGNIVLFLCGKNLKTRFKKATPLDCFSNFLHCLKHTLDLRYLEKETTWIDFGKEVVHPAMGIPNQPIEGNNCCLRSYKARIRNVIKLEKGGIQCAHYPWALTSESSNMTIVPTGRNAMRLAGLAYSQYYTSTKEIFDAGKIYPFMNDGIEAIAIDPRLTKAFQLAGGATVVNPEQVHRAYLASRDRTLQGLADSTWKSFGVREEHRVTVELLERITQELQKPQWYAKCTKLKDYPAVSPWFTISTMSVLDFLRFNLVRFLLPLEYLVAKSEGQEIGWETTKIMVMLIRSAKWCYRASPLQREAGLWRKKITVKSNGEEKEKLGMDFEGMMKVANYGWFGEGRIDWNTWTFTPSTSERMLFNNNALFQSFTARWPQVKSAREVYLALDSLRSPLQKTSSRNGILLARQYMNMQCIMMYRAYVWDFFQNDMVFDSQEDRAECLKGNISLCHKNLLERADPIKFQWKIIEPRTKSQKCVLNQVALIWGFDDEVQRGEWADQRPFRQLFQYCYGVLKESVGQIIADSWKQRFTTVFLKYTWTFPRTTTHHFILKDPKDQKAEKRYNWTTVVHQHVDEVRQQINWHKKELWKFGHENDYLQDEPSRFSILSLEDVCVALR
ncbi:hypothetical protein BDD12DRAFT_860927 [Trichophaea hybrida]|nr:hypothetical protein BDD12DRAFT_860927 [Trichophaea hybrida]